LLIEVDVERLGRFVLVLETVLQRGDRGSNAIVGLHGLVKLVVTRLDRDINVGNMSSELREVCTKRLYSPGPVLETGLQ